MTNEEFLLKLLKEKQEELANLINGYKSIEVEIGNLETMVHHLAALAGVELKPVQKARKKYTRRLRNGTLGS